MSEISQKRLRQSTLKLNSLLSITQAINENLSVDDMLKRFENILRKDLEIDKILFYKFEGEWKLVLSSNVPNDLSRQINLQKDLLHIDEITYVSSSTKDYLRVFDIVIPVMQNNQPVAFVLIGDVDEEQTGVSPSIKHQNFIQTLSIIIIVAIENIRLFNENIRQERIKKEMEMASKMQSMLIPDASQLPHNDRMYASAFYHPHFEVGGDYYDFLVLNKNEVGFCIADVSGKGMSAALLMSNFQANLRALFTSRMPLSGIITILNKRIIDNAKGEKFITLFIAKYNWQTRELQYVNAGHNPPIMYNKESEQLDYLTEGCIGIGMLDYIPIINTGQLTLEGDTKLLCYTDGLVELLNESEVEMGTQSIEECMTNADSIDDNIQEIIKKQNIERGNPAIFDDISLIGIEFY